MILAIGIDAAEASLVQRLIAEGQLPHLAALATHGRWMRVDAPAYIGSGSVWPTFIDGTDPAAHGVYGEWAWQPDSMSVTHYSGRGLRPFWRNFAADGYRVGVLDVPFMPVPAATSGFEIAEWGPHDVVEGRTLASPESLLSLLARAATHPLAVERLDAAGPHDYAALERLGRQSIEGIRRRGDLAIELLRESSLDLALFAFNEVHHASHHLWHAVTPDDAVYQNGAFAGTHATTPTLIELYTEVDRQIGRLVDAASPTAVVVFALHGMRAAHGIPAFLPELLTEWGYSASATWRSRSWRERAIAALAAAKRLMPPAVKRAYYRAVPTRIAQQVARPSMLPAYEWAATRAFSMPTDQHGWIRINLAGRERLGTVLPQDYERVLGELDDRFRALRTTDGRPLVADVARIAQTAEEAAQLRLPDLILHWTDAVFTPDLSIANSAVRTSATGTKFTGQHALDGFCLVGGSRDVWRRTEQSAPAGVLRARDFHAVFAALLARTRSARSASHG